MNNEEIKQNARDRIYRSEYTAWIDGMTDSQRAKMPADLLVPHLELRGAGSPELDESRLSDDDRLNYGCYDAGEPETEGGLEADHPQMDGAAEFPPEREPLQDSLRIMVAKVFENDLKPQLTIALIAVGLKVDGCTVRRVAQIHRLSQAEVRHRAADAIHDMEIATNDDRRVLRRLAGDLVSTSNARLSAEVMALVSGICYEGMSQTCISERHGITRAAVSKRCIEMANKMGLPPSRAMKSEVSRKSYRAAQTMPRCSDDNGIMIPAEHKGQNILVCPNCGKCEDS